MKKVSNKINNTNIYLDELSMDNSTYPDDKIYMLISKGEYFVLNKISPDEYTWSPLTLASVHIRTYMYYPKIFTALKVAMGLGTVYIFDNTLEMIVFLSEKEKADHGIY